MIEGIPVLGLGQGALISLVVLLVLTDRLVWRKRLDVLEERLKVLDEANRDLIKQNNILLSSAIPTVNAVLGALHEAAGLDDRERST